MEIMPNHYNPRVLLERVLLDQERVLTEGSLWLCAWCYRCYRRCPQKLKVPEILLAVKKIAAQQGYLGGFSEALKIVGEHVPFPAVYCRVCLHPERVMLDKQFVENVLQTVANLATKKRKEMAVPVQERENFKVAIIGSGPAGLTAAHELTQKGFSVTIFESMPKPGGMLRKCLPTYRLPRDVLDAEIKRMKDLGIEFVTNTTVGEHLTFEELRKDGFKAVFVATGAHKSRELNVEGCHLEGVVHALEFLREANIGKAKIGEKIVVVGGGNVAVDAARTVLRMGAQEVAILYRRSRGEMPANPWEVKEAETEGVEIRFLTSPKKILGESGRVTALECIKTSLGEPDESGRRKPIPVEGSEFTMESDMVILAVGEAPNLTFLPKEIEITEVGTIAVDPFTLETSMPGVFAGGDAVSGPATVVEAIMAGKRAASSIEHYLKGEA